MNRSRYPSKYVAWLAWCALSLIVFVSPLNRVFGGVPIDDPMPADCPMHVMDGMPQPHHPGAPDKFDPCAYCSLLFHSPALTGAVVLHVARVDAPSLDVPPGPSLALPVRQLPPRSRGPPSSA